MQKEIKVVVELCGLCTILVCWVGVQSSLFEDKYFMGDGVFLFVGSFFEIWCLRPWTGFRYFLSLDTGGGVWVANRGLVCFCFSILWGHLVPIPLALVFYVAFSSRRMKNTRHCPFPVCECSQAKEYEYGHRTLISCDRHMPRQFSCKKNKGLSDMKWTV